MPKKQTFIVETDKGSYEVDVEMPDGPEALSKNEPGMGGGDRISQFISKHVPGGDYLLGAQKGMAESVIGGPKGVVEGLAPGVVSGVKDMAMAPVNAVFEAVKIAKGAKNLYDDPEKVLNDAAASIGGIPAEMSKQWEELKTLARTNPEGFGKVIGEMIGAGAVGIVGSKMIPMLPKRAALRVGQAAEQVGRVSKYPAYVAGSYELASGNPLQAVATMSTPYAVQAAGEGLIRFGGGASIKDLKEIRHMAGAEREAWEMKAAELQAGEKNMQGEIADATKELDNEQAAAKIKAAREGRTVDSSIRRTTTADTGEGRETMTETFRPPEAGATADPLAGVSIRGQSVASMSPEVQARVRADITRSQAPRPDGGGPTRPPIRVGQPTAAKAPMPSDRRMDELTNKLGGRMPESTQGTTGPENPTDAARRQFQEKANALREDFKSKVEAVVRPESSSDLKTPATAATHEDRIDHAQSGLGIRVDDHTFIRPAPENVQQGSDLSPATMVSDIKTRTKAGGVRVSGRGPIRTKPGTATLSPEAQMEFDKYMKANPKADPKKVLAALRKITME